MPQSRIFSVANMFFNVIHENKIPRKFPNLQLIPVTLGYEVYWVMKYTHYTLHLKIRKVWSKLSNVDAFLFHTNDNKRSSHDRHYLRFLKW